MLESNPRLLRTNPKISSRFKIHQVNKHWLICDVIEEDINILTVKHISMDLIERLRDTEPTLEGEAIALFKQLKREKG